MIWHYTRGNVLPAILSSGAILPSSGARLEELPAVWFSSRRDWEPGASCGAQRDPCVAAAVAAALGGGQLAEQLERLRDPARLAAVVGLLLDAQRPFSAREIGGIARIGVAPEDAPLTWEEFLDLGGHARPEVVALQEEIDRANGADHSQWRASLAPVPSSRWLAVEWRSGERRGERWGPAPCF